MLLDTGPLVSFLADGSVHHTWTVEQWKQLRPPMLTCEPVLTEAAFLLKREGRDTECPFCAVGERNHSGGAFGEGPAGGSSRAHAPVSQSADVVGGRVSRSIV